MQLKHNFRGTGKFSYSIFNFQIRGILGLAKKGFYKQPSQL